MKAPTRSCRCAEPYNLCPACQRWGTRHPQGQDATYKGIPRRTWANPRDVQEIARLRHLGYPWTEIVALVGITTSALRVVRNLGLVEDTS